MVLARPIEVGALRYVKTLALNCCVGANIVKMYFLLLYNCMYYHVFPVFFNCVVRPSVFQKQFALVCNPNKL